MQEGIQLIAMITYKIKASVQHCIKAGHLVSGRLDETLTALIRTSTASLDSMSLNRPFHRRKHLALIQCRPVFPSNQNLASDGFPFIVSNDWRIVWIPKHHIKHSTTRVSLHLRNCIILKTLPVNMSKQKIDFSAAGIFHFFLHMRFPLRVPLGNVSALPFCSSIVIRIRHILRRSAAITRRDRTKRNHFPTPSKPDCKHKSLSL